jgi:putative acetyltransferase
MIMPTISIQVDDPAVARELIEQLDALHISLYPAESNHLLPLDALREANVTFLVARIDGTIAGCGAFVNNGDYAELKRMFVSPEFRGQKLGRRLLDELETRMKAAGIGIARLETGIAQAEALGLYERAGYRRRGPFGEYCEDPLSVFMEKCLHVR